jgi:hypothetical protein
MVGQPRERAGRHPDRARRDPHGRDPRLGYQPVHGRPADAEPVGDLPQAIRAGFGPWRPSDWNDSWISCRQS